MIIILDQSMSHLSTRLLHVHTYIESTRWQVLLMHDDGEFYLCITIKSFTYELRSRVLLMHKDDFLSDQAKHCDCATKSEMRYQDKTNIETISE